MLLLHIIILLLLLLPQLYLHHSLQRDHDLCAVLVGGPAHPQWAVLKSAESASLSAYHCRYHHPLRGDCQALCQRDGRMVSGQGGGESDRLGCLTQWIGLSLCWDNF